MNSHERSTGRKDTVCDDGRRCAIKVFHGPTNIAGIGGSLADWERRQGAKSIFVTFNDRSNRQNHHLNLCLDQHGRFKRLWIRMALFLKCLRSYDLFHFYFGQTLLPFGLDLPLLKLFGKRIVMTYCGSEVRLVSVERRRNPYHRFLKYSLDHPRWDRLKKLMTRWQGLWLDRAFAVRNQYASCACTIPRRKLLNRPWLHNAMNLRQKDVMVRDSCSSRDVVIIHAPTSPEIKGTEHVESAISDLTNRGYRFVYRRIQGVSNQEMQRIIREEADIVVDQLYLGGFGSLAVEGMCYSKVVCCYLIESLKQEEFPDCPIVNVNIDNLADKLAWLIENPQERERIGKEGRAYVEKYFDREKIYPEVWKLYHELLGRPLPDESDGRPTHATDAEADESLRACA